MIVEVHGHAWRYPQGFIDAFRAQVRRARAGVEIDLTVCYEDYQRASVTGVNHRIRRQGPPQRRMGRTSAARSAPSMASACCAARRPSTTSRRSRCT